MAINLQKGQRVGVTIPKFTVGLGWDTNESQGGVDFDLDASVFVLNESKKLISDDYFVFYNNLNSPDGAICHQGDNRTGDGDGDDEMIVVDLSKINPSATELYFVVTIDEAAARRQNFGQVRNSFVRIYNTDTNEEILKYELDEDFSIETAVEFGRLYLRNGEWKFEAVGLGNSNGLEYFVNKFQ